MGAVLWAGILIGSLFGCMIGAGLAIAISDLGNWRRQARALFGMKCIVCRSNFEPHRNDWKCEHVPCRRCGANLRPTMDATPEGRRRAAEAAKLAADKERAAAYNEALKEQER